MVFAHQHSPHNNLSSSLCLHPRFITRLPLPLDLTVVHDVQPQLLVPVAWWQTSVLMHPTKSGFDGGFIIEEI